MTEVTAGVPASGAHYDPDQTDVALTAVPADDSLEHVEPAAPSYSFAAAQPGQSSFRGSVNDAGEKVSAFASDTTDKVSAFASDTGERVSAFASETGDKVGAFASETSEKVGAFASETADRAGDYVEKAAGATGRLANQVADRLRNNAELANDRGTTTIGDEVVEKIAGFATRQVEGIYDLGGNLARALASVKERVGLGEADEQSDRGVTVRLEGGSAAIKIVIVIEYGYVVYTVAEQVRTKVISAVETLLGLDVTAVDVVVDDVHIDESKLAETVKAVTAK
jgi:uncharacterized alkaline shock family protein YloU